MKTLKQLKATASNVTPTRALNYNYSAIDQSVAAEMKNSVGTIRDCLRDEKVAALSIGHSLLAISKKLPHGEFVKWIKAEFAWSTSTAYNYMNVARLAEENPAVEKLPMKAAYALAAKSTSPEVVKEVVSKVEKGEKLTVGNVISFIKAKKPAAAKEPMAEVIAHDDKVAWAPKPETAGVDGDLVKRLQEIGLEAALEAMDKAFPGFNIAIEATDAPAAA